ncbi:MAG TPA: hypothetical protein PKA31_03845 [Candidatus Moranbacteria bacterium]|nr:hypothetical protein [Candidatus Moranbacteria bacterium]
MKTWFGSHVELFNGTSLLQKKIAEIEKICGILPLHVAPYGKVRWRKDVGYKCSPEIMPQKNSFCFSIIDGKIVISVYLENSWQDIALIPLAETVLAIKDDTIVALEKKIVPTPDKSPPGR